MFKKSKNCHFSKGVNPQFLRKLAIFATSFFQAKQATKMCFTIFQNEKTPFQAIKTRSSKSQKIAIFLKGLTNCFGRKMAIFLTSFFWGNIGQENVFYDILERKNAILGYKKRRSKTRKIAIILKELTHFFCTIIACFATSFY